MPVAASRRRPEGIAIRHGRSCASRSEGESCDCCPGFAHLLIDMEAQIREQGQIKGNRAPGSFMSAILKSVDVVDEVRVVDVRQRAKVPA